MLTADERHEQVRALELGGRDRPLDLVSSHGGWIAPGQLEAGRSGYLRYRTLEPTTDPLGRARHRVLLGPVVTSTRELLADFVNLGEAGDDEIIAFARRFGPLGLCAEHGLLPAHQPGPRCPALPLDGEGWAEEPLDHWREYAQVIRAALDLAAIVANDPGGVRSHIEHAVVIEKVLRQWLDGASPVFRWRDGSPETTWTPGGLAGAIGIEASLAIARRDGVAVCAGCGTTFLPRRKPRAGDQTWCGDEACRRERQRRHTAKSRSKASGRRPSSTVRSGR